MKAIEYMVAKDVDLKCKVVSPCFSVNDVILSKFSLLDKAEVSFPDLPERSV